MTFLDISRIPREQNRFLQSIWASTDSEAERLVGVIEGIIRDQVLTQNSDWIAIVGGRPFGCKLVETMRSYSQTLSTEEDHVHLVSERMAQVNADAMALLETLVRRVTPPTIERVSERWSDLAIEELLTSGLANFDTNRKGSTVLRDIWELRPAVRYEFERRSRLWRLISKFALFECYLIRDLEFIRGTYDTYRMNIVANCCEACQKWENREFPAIEEPPIPHIECTNPLGCSCSVTPVLTVLDDGYDW